MNEYTGPERRQNHLELDAALQEVQRLHGAVSTLATAVTNTVPKQELQALREEVKRDFYLKIYIQIGIVLVVTALALLLINVKLNNSAKAAERSHQIIRCLLTKTEVQRTGDLGPTAIVTCQATATK